MGYETVEILDLLAEKAHNDLTIKPEEKMMPTRTPGENMDYRRSGGYQRPEAGLSSRCSEKGGHCGWKKKKSESGQRQMCWNSG